MGGRQKDDLEGAILAVDAVGYSRLMGKDEKATVRRLHTYRGLIQSLATQHGGRVFGVAGDSEMAIFAKAGDAVRCALEVQKAIGERNAILPKDSRMPVRIGINYGQVIVEDDSFFGDDINVAARVESFAEAGEVCLSGTVFDRVKASKAWGFDSFGEERFKNIARPVRVYRVRTEPEALGQVIPAKRRKPKPGRIWRTAAAASLIALIGATGWGIKVQVEKRRAEAEVASVIADAQSSVTSAEAKISRLLDDLHQSEERATDERERIEALLASLQAIRNQADLNEQTALEQANEAQDLLALLHTAEQRAEVERENARKLLAALEDAEKQVAAAREAADRERQARQDAERRAADTTLMETLLASWRTAERQAAEERARAQALLTALQDVEGRAETERQAKLEQQRTEDLLARLNEAYDLAVRERKRAEDLYVQVKDARDKVADEEGVAQRLDVEIVRIEALLGTLQDAESRVAAERDRVEGMLETLRRAEPGRPPEDPQGERDGSGGQWQDVQGDSLERAELLFAKWTEAEQKAANERSRAEDLLTALETTSQLARAPPPVPPPKPEFPSVPEASVSEEGSSDEPVRPAPGDKQSEATGPEALQLAHNPVDETQALRPQMSLAPIMPVIRTEYPWDGTWTGGNDIWTVELKVVEGQFLLDAFCDGVTPFRDSVSGNISDTGQISAILSSPSPLLGWPNGRIPVSGNPEALNLHNNGPRCTGGTLKLARVADGPTVALATESSFNQFDGKWVGRASAVRSGPRCAVTFPIEITVGGRNFTGFANDMQSRWNSYMRVFSGTVDSSGRIESKRVSLQKNEYHGTLLAGLGKGSGEWFSEECSGTFELTRIEQPSG